MKQQVRTLACGAALAAAIVFTIAGCGGRQTMASKSASAYDEARKKGIPISAGEHGGHAAETPAVESVATSSAPDATPRMDHGSMPGMQHDASTGAAHNTAGMDHSSMAGMDHSKMPGMQHGASTGAAHDMAGMDHSSMAGMDHSRMPGMQHGATHDMSGMTHGSMPDMQHAPSGSAVAPAPPTTNTAIAQTQPAATLRSDDFDAPAQTAIDEAAKGASGMTHPPQPQPPTGHQHHGGAS